MNNDKPLDKILPLLKNVKQGGKGWSARCPAHEDKQNSLSVREVDDGKLLVKCFSGCETKEVLLRNPAISSHRSGRNPASGSEVIQPTSRRSDAEPFQF